MVVIALVTTRIANVVDLALLDTQHRLAARFTPRTVSANVVIVGIDEISREGLYKALSSTGNPELSTVFKVARALGVRLHAVPAA